jgi:hypothetical protein
MKSGRRMSALWVTLAIGVGLVLAPVVFQMFSRGPAGGDMIDDFEPYMTPEEISTFRGYMDVIGQADAEAVDLRNDLDTWDALAADEHTTSLAAVVKLNDSWPGIDADMTDLLDRMDANLDNYAAVAALPPFALFPWFFVAPGLLIVGLSASVLWTTRQRGRTTRQLWALAGVGLAVALAPVAFQMFSRAPQGADMIDDFRPMMTRERVLDVQSYFVTMGAAEGQLRVAALPLAADAGDVDAAERYVAISAFSADWPTIVGDFSPMVATMSDNVDNFEGIDALPPFGLFPWFFVLPGLLVAVVAALTAREATEPTVSPQSDPRSTT